MLEGRNNKLIALVIIISVFAGSLFGSLSALVVTGAFGKKYVPGPIKQIIKKDIKSDDGETSGVKVVSEQSAVISAVKKVSPAVVSIIVTKDIPKIHSFRNEPFEDFFGDFFGDMPSPFKQRDPETDSQPEKREVGGGTGFIITSDGLIITNKHVINDSNAEYSVLFNDGKRYAAKIIGVDPVNDIGFIKINKKGLKVAELGDSGKLQIGQSVIAIGNALGEFRNTVSTGVISGLKRSITAGGTQGVPEQLSGVIQTDAAINFGNSGGPLLNIDGHVIGINTAVAVSGGAQNIGFAIPVNDAKADFESIVKEGKIVKAFLGIRYIQVNKAIKQRNNLSVDYGALIIRGENQKELPVVPGSPADKAGLKENDIIIEFGGQKITEENTLAQLIGKRKVGEKVKLKVLSKGKERTAEVKLAAAPE